MEDIRAQPEQNELSTDLTTITSEINAYKRIAGEAIFEIGRRLKHARDEIFTDSKAKQSGEWSEWCEGTLDISRKQAQRLIKVAEEFPKAESTWSRLPFRTLYEIATLPPDEREKEHDGKTPDEMTVKELRELKRQLKAEKERAEVAERDAEIAKKHAEQTPEPEVHVEEPADYSTLKAENEKYRRLYGEPTIYDDSTRRVGNDDAITYNVFELTEDVRKFVEKYGHLTYFPREFASMIDEGKDEYRKAIGELGEFIGRMERMLSEDEEIIIETEES